MEERTPTVNEVMRLTHTGKVKPLDGVAGAKGESGACRRARRLAALN